MLLLWKSAMYFVSSKNMVCGAASERASRRVHLLRGAGASATARVAGAAYTWLVARGTLPARFGARRLMACLAAWPGLCLLSRSEQGSPHSVVWIWATIMYLGLHYTESYLG